MFSTLILLLALGAEPKAIIKTQAVVQEGSTIILDARASVSDKPLAWKFSGPDVPFLTFDQGDRKGIYGLVPSPPKGVYKFILIAKGKVGEDLDADADIAIVNVNGVTPPLPPTPVPVPVPPTPVPVPSDQLRVILMYESSDKMTREQINTLNSTAVRSYLSSRCMTDGGLPAWRCWDKDVDASKETLTWQAAWAQAKTDATPLPKFVIFSGSTMKAIPFPETELQAIDLLKTYGGR